MKKQKSIITNHYENATLLKVFSSIMKGLDTVKLPREDLHNSFRVSSLPYCPIMDLYNRAKEKEARPFDDYPSSFYFRVGTAIHELIQEALSSLDSKGDTKWIPIGSWECTKCKKIIGELEPCPKVCKCGSRSFSYVEAQFNWKGLTGHCDYIVYIPSLKGYILFEFKSKGSKKVETGLYLPDAKHHHQAQTYSWMMQKHLKKIGSDRKVLGYGIIYIGRDGPYFYKIGSGKVLQHKICAYEWTKSMAAIRKKQLLLALRGRRALESAIKGGHIKNMIGYKPCSSIEDYYNNGQHDPYIGAWSEDGKEVMCPFAKDKKCFCGKIYKEVDKLIKVVIK